MAVVTGDMLRELLAGLEQAVPATAGRGQATVPQVHWQRCEVESSYQTGIVTVSYADRPDLRVFVKDYGSVEQAKHDLEARRERERHVYDTLLAGARLDTARLYGSVWDRDAGRFCLFLEFVEGTPLKYADFDYWPQAAAWLGRMHGHFARDADRLNATGLLIEHDARFFLSIAEHALRSVRVLLPRRLPELEAIVQRYDRLVALMSDQPRTLVHGAYRPEQILVGMQRQPPRFCPVDWELAAIGSGCYDLAFLADGFEPPRLDRVLDEYRDAVAACGVRLPAPDDVKYLVNCFRLHRVFTWLSHAVDRRYAEKDVIKLAESANRIADSLF